jgi:hypothetical protein
VGLVAPGNIAGEHQRNTEGEGVIRSVSDDGTEVQEDQPLSRVTGCRGLDGRRHSPPTRLPFDDDREVLDEFGAIEVGVYPDTHHLTRLHRRWPDQTRDLWPTRVLRVTRWNLGVWLLCSVDVNIRRFLRPRFTAGGAVCRTRDACAGEDRGEGENETVSSLHTRR